MSIAQEDWWQYLQRVRAELVVAGGPFRTTEDIAQERREFRRVHKSTDDKMPRRIKSE